MHVYRNCSKPTPPLEPKEECEVFIRQWNSLQEFFAHWEKNSEGNRRTCNNYRDLQEFEELFREHFHFLSGQVEREIGHKVLGKKVRRWKSCPFRGLISLISNTPRSSTVERKRSGKCWKPWKRKSERNGRSCWSWVRAAQEKLAGASGRASAVNAARNH